MEFPVDKEPRIQTDKYTEEEIDLAFKFSKIILKEFSSFIKAVAVFGSAAKGKEVKGDIDILVVVDDLTLVMTSELVQAYRIITENAVRQISIKLHITTLKFTSFWEYVRAGDPVVVNILRDGVAIYDTGFFYPLQALLRNGRIRPSPEAMWSYFVRAPATIHNSKWHIMQATLDLYWAVIDSAHAALIKVNETPPRPEDIADMLKEKLVERGKIDKKYPQMMRRFYELSRMITHREIKEISGQEYANYLHDAEDFVDAMKRFIERG